MGTVGAQAESVIEVSSAQGRGICEEESGRLGQQNRRGGLVHGMPSLPSRLRMPDCEVLCSCAQLLAHCLLTSSCMLLVAGPLHPLANASPSFQGRRAVLNGAAYVCASAWGWLRLTPRVDGPHGADLFPPCPQDDYGQEHAGVEASKCRGRSAGVGIPPYA